LDLVSKRFFPENELVPLLMMDKKTKTIEKISKFEKRIFKMLERKLYKLYTASINSG
jgi:hypothetical protein